MDPFFIQSDPDARQTSAQRKKIKAAENAARRMGGVIVSSSAGRGTKRGSDRRGKDKDDAESDEEQTVDDMDLMGSGDDDGGSEEDEVLRKETAAQKRLRLAKSYLAKVREDVDDVRDGEIDAAELDRDLIAERLQNDALEAAGKLFHQIASKYRHLDLAQHTRIFKSGKQGHELAVTGVAFAAPSPSVLSKAGIPSNGSPYAPMYIYSVSKDAMIVKWDFWTGEKLRVQKGNLKPTKKLVAAMGRKAIKGQTGHNDNILAVAASSDGKYLATGGLDKIIHLWSVIDGSHITSFKQHRDAISGLKFRHGENQLYSASFDRSVKVWNADEQAYVETLFGHQDHVTSIDALARERCITSGARDRTVRLWKIPEESQLVYRAGGGLAVSEDLVVLDDLVKKAIAMLDEDHFVTGSDSGAISIWESMKKKPSFTRLAAHGAGSSVLINGNSSKASEDVQCCWITALAAVPYSDLFASGSCDGYVKLWHVGSTKRNFTLINAIPITGFVNSLVFFEAPLATAAIEKQNAKAQQEAPATSAIAARIKAKEKAKRDAAAIARHPHLAIGVGQEHRLGRWWREKNAKNQVVVVGLVGKSAK